MPSSKAIISGIIPAVLTTDITSSASFGAFVFANRRNRWLLGIALLVAVIKIVVFKHFFPDLDFTSDTGSYIGAALYKLDCSVWPVGYSRFLWLFHQVLHTETALAIVQFALLELSSLFFYFSVLYIFRAEGYFRYGCYAFLLVNPLFVFLSNYVISDALFLSLGLTWITLLLWILHKPTMALLIFHGLLLGVAFTVRYNAMFYPAVALIPILLSRYKPWQKVLAILLPLVLIVAFVTFMRQRTYEHSGVKIFSAFSGWQMMNNAMYMLQYQKIDTTAIPPAFTAVHRLVYHYCDSLQHAPKKILLTDGSLFMWDNNGPEKKLMGEYLHVHPKVDVFTGWAAMSPLFGSFGQYMIKKYPLDFAHYYLLPNAKMYILPDLEVLGIYNRPFIGIEPKEVKAMFKNGDKPRPMGKYNDLQSLLMALFPSLILVCHVVFLEETIRYLIKKGIRKTPRKFNIALLLCWVFILINFAFSVFAAPIVLRYQVLLILLLLSYTLLLTEITDAPPEVAPV
ncbi:hypothetical protein ACDQ55_07785 [Chitinophaga sp. 30R24]|uniref:hypothetical protein n=1 Tax=Chitinophaga sp. 30R24 TaxID=3248838 RepID=UPI003B91A1DF